MSITRAHRVCLYLNIDVQCTCSLNLFAWLENMENWHQSHKYTWACKQHSLTRRCGKNGKQQTNTQWKMNDWSRRRRRYCHRRRNRYHRNLMIACASMCMCVRHRFSMCSCVPRQVVAIFLSKNFSVQSKITAFLLIVVNLIDYWLNV